jgi:hypothetical protein
LWETPVGDQEDVLKKQTLGLGRCGARGGVQQGGLAVLKLAKGLDSLTIST